MNLIVNRHLDRTQKQVIYELTLKKRQSKKSTMSEKHVAAREQLAFELMQERRVPIRLRAQDSLISNASSSSSSSATSASTSSSVDCRLYGHQHHSFSGACTIEERAPIVRGLNSSRSALLSSPLDQHTPLNSPMAPLRVQSAINCKHHRHQCDDKRQKHTVIVDRRVSLKHQEAVDYSTSVELETDIEARKKEANIKFNKTRLEHLNLELERRLQQYEYLVAKEKALLGAYNMMLFTSEGVNNFHL